jgi:hypothetical protein
MHPSALFRYLIFALPHLSRRFVFLFPGFAGWRLASCDRVLVLPAILFFPVCFMRSCMDLTGSCMSSLHFALAFDPASACQTVHLRLPHSAHISLTMRASWNSSFGARSQGYLLAVYASTLRLLYTGKTRFRLLELALPGEFGLSLSQGHYVWFLLDFNPLVSSIHRFCLSRSE